VYGSVPNNVQEMCEECHRKSFYRRVSFRVADGEIEIIGEEMEFKMKDTYEAIGWAEAFCGWCDLILSMIYVASDHDWDSMRGVVVKCPKCQNPHWFHRCYPCDEGSVQIIEETHEC
jgi:hypothetical protein